MDAARLEGIPLFDGISKNERRQVARWADEVDVAAGQHLVDQHRLAYEFFVIEEGTAEVVKDGERIAQLGPGDFFGEIALLEEDRRTASVVAGSPMRVIVMTERDFREMGREMPEVAERIRKAAAERLGGAGRDD